jgi:hypothetical protein
MPLYGQPNATTPVTFLSYPNDVTGGLFWTLMIFAVFMITFGVQKTNPRNSSTVSLTTSSVFASVFALFLFLLDANLIPSYVLTITMLSSLFGVIILLWQNQNRVSTA